MVCLYYSSCICWIKASQNYVLFNLKTNPLFLSRSGRTTPSVFNPFSTCTLNKFAIVNAMCMRCFDPASRSCGEQQYDMLWAKSNRSIGEIDMFAQRCRFSNGRQWVIPLHSSVAPDEQRRAFQTPPPGVRKVVVGTNIAETSITIDDVVYVVDSGKLKERRYNASRGMSMLVLGHVSQVRFESSYSCNEYSVLKCWYEQAFCV